jgi:hypothetical protein
VFNGILPNGNQVFIGSNYITVTTRWLDDSYVMSAIAADPTSEPFFQSDFATSFANGGHRADGEGGAYLVGGGR